MTLRRRPDWPDLLAAFIAARRARPFEWGGNDCCTFAIDWVETMTGERVWQPDWTDARGAQETLKRVGGMRQAWTDTLGPARQNWTEARRGDVGLADIAGRLCGVVCTGPGWTGPGPERLGALALPAASILWNVG